MAGFVRHPNRVAQPSSTTIPPTPSLDGSEPTNTLAAPPKFPTDPEQVRPLIEQGLSDTAIAKLFGASRTAYTKYRERHGLPGNPERSGRRITHSDFIPWTVGNSTRHSQHPLLARLKDCDTLLKGGKLRNESTEAFLEEWGRWMDGGNPTGKKLSVDYDPEDADGFFLVERKRGDKHRMRMPGPDHPARRV